MPQQAAKVTEDKFEHLVKDEPKRDGKDYGPDDDFSEIVSSDPGVGEDALDADAQAQPNYSSEGSSGDMDMGGENYSHDPGAAQEAEPEPKSGEHTGEPDTEHDKPAKKEQTPAAKRVSELIRQRNKANEEVAYYRGIVEGRARQGEPAADPVPDQPAAQKPRLADFESYEDYTEAMSDFKFAERDKKNAVDSEVAAVESTREVLAEKLKAGLTKYDDFVAVANAPNLAINDTMVEALAESENAADISYHLGQHPDEAFRISQLSPVAAGREIAKLDLKFTGSPKPNPKPVRKTTQATEPIEPVNTGGTDINRKTLDEMTMDEYVNHRTKGGKRRV